MSITLVAVVIALVLGHVAPALVTSARQFTWFGQWLQWLDTRFAEGSFWRGRYGIAIALLYWVLLHIFLAIGGAGLLPPVLAGWSANIIVAGAASVLFLNTKT